MNPKKLIRKLLPKKQIHTVENAYRQVRGHFWAARYGFPAKKMKVIAVTGTNGKTTTCNYINKVLQTGGKRTALWTTENIEIGGVSRQNKTHYTLQKQKYAQKFFSQAKKAGAEWVILEVTSHALDQKRIQGVPVEIAVFTNLSREHLDYHKTMENYAAAKARLFSEEFSPKYCVLNTDDEWFEFFKSRSSGNVIGYGQSRSAEVHLSELNVSSEGSSAVVQFEGQTSRLKTKLIGEFNLMNAAAAYSVGKALLLEDEQILKGVETLEPVPGRMNVIKKGGISAVIDFGVTPDAIEKTLLSLKQIASGKVAIVFGATGDRDRQKRPMLGIVAAKNADKIYLTDDETYSEDGDFIRSEVMSGIKEAKGEKKTIEIADREKAIKQAIAEAIKGDIILITGIGNETYRNMDGKKVPWNEGAIIEKYLKA